MEKPRFREVEYISSAFPVSFCPASQGWQGCDLDPGLSHVKLVPSSLLCTKTSRAPFRENGSENHGASPSPPTWPCARPAYPSFLTSCLTCPPSPLLASVLTSQAQSASGGQTPNLGRVLGKLCRWYAPSPLLPCQLDTPPSLESLG